MPRVMISTTISVEDHAFCKTNNLKWSKLMESAISITRKAIEDGNDSDLANYYKRKVEAMIKRVETLTNFISDHGLYDDYLKSKGKKGENV